MNRENTHRAIVLIAFAILVLLYISSGTPQSTTPAPSAAQQKEVAELKKAARRFAGKSKLARRALHGATEAETLTVLGSLLHVAALGKIYHDRQTCAGTNTRLRLGAQSGIPVKFTTVGDCWPYCPRQAFEVLRISPNKD